jgi:hypothetical protein
MKGCDQVIVGLRRGSKIHISKVLIVLYGLKHGIFTFAKGNKLEIFTHKIYMKIVVCKRERLMLMISFVHML